MTYKLKVNRDHFEDEDARAGYVLSRTGGRVASYTYARQNPSSPNPFLSRKDVMEKRNDCREYNALEDQLIDDLRDKISPRLCTNRTGLGIELDTLRAVKNYLVRVESEYRSIASSRETKAAQRADNSRPLASKRVSIARPGTPPLSRAHFSFLAGPHQAMNSELWLNKETLTSSVTRLGTS